MTQPAAVTLGQTILIQSANTIVVTDPVDDGTGTGTFVREIRIFGDPLGTNGPAVLIARVTSQTKTNIEITTPTLQF